LDYWNNQNISRLLFELAHLRWKIGCNIQMLVVHSSQDLDERRVYPMSVPLDNAHECRFNARLAESNIWYTRMKGIKSGERRES